MTVNFHSGRRIQGLSTDFQTSGLKAYWKMNEASGNLLNTASAQNSDSTMSADLVSSGTVNRGQAGHVSGVDSIGFPTYDADGNKVTANNSASDYGFMNKAAAKFTVCWWAKNESYNSTGDLWGFGGNGGGNDIQIRNKSSGFTIWLSGTEYTSFTHNVADNNWHFYMLSWDEDGGSDNVQFQLDGTKQTATVTTSNTSDASSPLIIGDVSGNEPEMDIQEFSLWNRVLTDAEIAEIYNSGNGAELQNTTIVGSKPTNVQTGSRLEETDTRKIYSSEQSSNVTQITDGSHTVLQFTGNATFTPSSSFNVEAIVVAGGGGSGGGGGGAGGIVYDAVKAVTAQSYTITVGSGGDGGSNSYNGTAGEDSVFDNITAKGGGYGAKDNTNGGSGGSGGGGGATSINVGAGGSATQTASGGDTGYGNAGGSFGNNSAPHPNGGGGGAGGAGGNGSGSTCGSGGIGIVNPISGSTIGELSGGSYYLGGGGGGGRSGLTQGSGGLGGGGNGSASTGENGTANTGGGGGGSFGNTSAGNGGSGVVILRFLTSGNSWSANEWQEIGA